MAKHDAILAGRSWYALRVSPRSLMLTKRQRSRMVNGTRQPFTEYVFPAEEALAARGFNPFVPTEGVWRRRSRYYRAKDRERVRRPLLTGYILIDPPEPADWFAIMSLPFVSGVIVRAGWPARIAKDDDFDVRHPIPKDRFGRAMRLPQGLSEVVAKHTVIADENKIHMPTNRTFEVGDTVEMVEDPLDAFKGLPIRVKDIEGDKTTILTTLFGAEVEIAGVDTWKLAKWAGDSRSL